MVAIDVRRQIEVYPRLFRALGLARVGEVGEVQLEGEGKKTLACVADTRATVGCQTLLMRLSQR